MSLALNKPRLDNLAAEIWKSAVRLRGKFKAAEYQGVILPIIVIRRLECVLIRWREERRAEVLARRPGLDQEALHKLVKGMELGTAPFSNRTDMTLSSLYREDHTLLEANFRKYINGFSDNVQEIIERFNYIAIIGEMVKRNRLAAIISQYKDAPLGPEQLSNLEMGYVYEELLRRFSEEAGEEAGDHFTPREVIRLMVELLEIPVPTRHLAIYDPACGTGGMLSVAKEHLFDRAATDAERAAVEELVTVHGQELQPANYAVCKADLLLKGDTQAEVYYGNSLIPHLPHGKEPGDQLPESRYRFDYMLSNPPFGVTWGGKEGYEDAARRLRSTRYRAGMPRVSDGALLFLQTMIAKMRPPAEGGSRIAVVFNGSPLSNGDCGSGESEIRRWILENDWLDAIVMLPDQLFYNTGIFTYIWLLRNEKPVDHRGRVMLIDARRQYEKEPKAFSNKRNRMTDAHREWIEERYRDGWAHGYTDPDVRLFANTEDDIAITALVEEDLPSVLCGYHLALIRPNQNRLHPLFLAWLHACKIFRAQYEIQATGVTRFCLSHAVFASARIPLPPLDEQAKIATFLDASCRALDAAISLKGWQLTILEGLRKAVVQQVVTRGVHNSSELCATANAWIELVPSDWQLVALKRLVHIQTGLTLGTQYEGVVIERPYLRVANVQDGHLDLGDVTTIEVPVELAARIELRPGDVLMTEGGDLDKLGRGVVWNGEIEGCLHQNHIFAVRCFRHKLLPKFLAYLTSSRYARDYFEATGKRTTNLASTNATKVGQFPIPLPNLDEQARLVEYLDHRLEELRAVERVIRQQIDTLTAYRKSLIFECVTGRRRVTEEDLRRVESVAADRTRASVDLPP